MIGSKVSHGFPWKFLIATGFAVALLGGINPRGAELVPFRGTETSGLKVEMPSASNEKRSSETPDAEWESVEAEFRTAAVAMGRGELADARKAFAAILVRQPQHLGSLINLGWVAQREKAWGEAEGYLKRAQVLAPENASVWLALGVVYLAQDKVDFALAAFSQTVALEPTNARARRMLGLTLGRKEWYSAAEGELRRSLEIEPNDAGAHFNLAVIYLQRQPAAIELARRHYHLSMDLGSAPDSKMDAMFAQNNDPIPQGKGIRN